MVILAFWIGVFDLLVLIGSVASALAGGHPFLPGAFEWAGIGAQLAAVGLAMRGRPSGELSAGQLVWRSAAWLALLAGAAVFDVLLVIRLGAPAYGLVNLPVLVVAARRRPWARATHPMTSRADAQTSVASAWTG